MHSRDYSEHISEVIDDEIERILREQETRAIELLTCHRGGLNAVAKALLELETIDGATVGRLVDEAYGRPVHATGPKAVVPTLNGVAPPAPTDRDVPSKPGPPAWDPPAWPGVGTEQRG